MKPPTTIQKLEYLRSVMQAAQLVNMPMHVWHSDILALEEALLNLREKKQ
jgi:hypothetical protein